VSGAHRGHDPKYRVYMVAVTAMGNRLFGSWWRALPRERYAEVGDIR
jgi:hypothetical protein